MTSIRNSALAGAFLMAASAAAWAQQNGNGLYAEYYNANNFTAQVATGTSVGPIDFDYAAGTPDALVTNADNFSTRWRAQIEGPVSDTVTFTVQTSDVVRVFINGQQIVSANNNTATGNLAMIAGQRYDFLVEHVETTGTAQLRVSWSWPAAPSVIVIPKNRFYSPTGGAIVPAAVTFTPNGGEATPPLSVTLAGPAAGVPIYFTLDGSDPGLNSPLSNPQACLYTVPFNVSTYVRINARAYNLGVPGPLATSNQFSPQFPAFSPLPTTGGGLYRRLYQHGGGLGNAMPNWEAQIPQQRRIETLPFNGVDSGTDVTSAIGNRTVNGVAINDNFACRFTGFIDMPASGLWTFQLNSDDDSRVFIDGVLVVHATATNTDTNGQIALAAGMHSIVVDYYDGTGGNRIFLRYQGPTVAAFTVIPSSRFFTELISPTPALNPSTQNPFDPSTTVQLDIPGGGPGTIYYTTDGSAPDPRNCTGSGATGVSFPISATTRVRAITVRANEHPSAMLDVTIVRNNPPAASAIVNVIAAGVAAPVSNSEVEVNFNRTVVGGAETPSNYVISGGGNPVPSAAVRVPRNADLKAWWTLDDGGTTADDSGVNNLDGAHNGTPTQDVGNKATLDFTNTSSLTFDGTDYVSVPHNAALDFGTRDFTIALWVNPTGTAEYPLINKWNQATPKGWSLNINQTAAGNIVFRAHDGTLDEVHTVAGGVVAGVWQHIVVRFDRASLRTTIFRNGAPVGAVRDMTLTYANADTTAALELGRLVAAATTQLDGKLDDVRVYGVALSNEEILGLFQGAQDPSTRVLLTTPALSTATLNHVMTVSGLTDANGAPVSGTANFVYRSGRMTHERFSGGANTAVTDLTRMAIYPNSPTERVTTTSSAIDLNLDTYGGRLRGYFIPNQTGKWRFAIASDDNGELWLSSDSDPARKVLISRCTVWADPYQFADPDVVQSAPIVLTSGTKYYIEALYKENNGGDHCTVGARYVQADDTVMIPNGVGALPGLAADAIPASMLAPYIPNLAITAQPFSREIQAGGTVSFTVTASGGADAHTFQWKAGGTNIVIGGRFAVTNVVSTTSTTSTLTITGALDVTDEVNYTVDVTNQGGTITSSPAALVIRPAGAAPFVSAIAPVSGPTWGGVPLKVTGSNFLIGQTSIAIGAATLTDLVYFPDGQTILAFSPVSPAPGARDVVASHLGQTGAPLVGGYTYNAPPIVSSLSSVAGTNEGGELVTIFGFNFLPGPTFVKFGALDATNVNVALDGMSLTCNVPGPALGTVNVTVITSILPGAKLGAYTYYDNPTIGTVTAAFGTDAGGQLVTITGMNFAPMPLTSVTFGGTAATVQSVALDGQSLTCLTPVRNGVVSKLDVAVVVNTPGGSANLTPGFTYYADPTIGTILPNSGPDGGSQVVTITGSGFSPDTAVTFGGTAGTPVNVLSDTSLEVTTPLRAGVTTSLTVAVAITAAGGNVSNPTGYTYWADPTFGVLSTPLGIPDGPQTGSQTVTITGTNFVDGATTVTFGANTPVNTSSVNGTGTSLTVVTPVNAFAAGLVNVTITTPGGSVTSNGAYTYHLAPDITDLTGINPSSGRTAGNEPVTISGSNFPASKTSVAFDGLPAGSVVASGNSIACNTPAHASGAVTVLVTTPGGSDTISFTYNAGPFVNQITPNVGPVVGGRSATITGSGLLGATQVTIGGAVATIVGTPTANTINITTPAGTAGAARDVVVTTPADTFTLAAAYTYTGTPTIGTITLNQGPVSGNVPVVITGTNFADTLNTEVTFGGVAGTVNSVNGTFTSMNVTPPANATAGAVNVVVTTYTNQPSAPLVAGYTYVAAPTISTMAPTRGPMAGGQTVDITGTNFVNGSTEVLVNGVPVTPSLVTTSTLRFTTPSNASATTVPIVVRTFASAPSSSSSVNYTYVNQATAVDLELTKDVDNPITGVGQNVVFTITLRNFGQVAGTNVVVNDSLPAGLTYVSHVASTGTYTPGTGNWAVPTIAATNGLATLTITATVATSSNHINTAEVTGATQEDVDSLYTPGGPAEDDRDSASVDAGLQIQVQAPPSGTGKAFYSFTFSATGGTQPYTWSILNATPSFPFNLNTVTGEISGFAPDATQVYTFDVRVTDASATPQVDTLIGVTVSIAAAAAGTPVISGAAMPNGVVGQPYSFNFTATGGQAPYDWTVSAGTLPAGLSLNRFTGLLAGTPTAAASPAASFSVTATSTTPTASAPRVVNALTISPNPVTITPGSLPNGTDNAFYEQYVEVVGGVGPFTWSFSGTFAPLTMPVTTGRVIRITGTLGTGDQNFTLQVVDGGQALPAATRAFTVTTAAVGGPIVITQPAAGFPEATQGRPYSVTLSGTGGPNGSYFWQLDPSSSLPPGLTLNGGSGIISGTPSAPGVYGFTVTAGAFGGGVPPGSASLTITVAAPPSAPASLALPAAVQNSGYFAQLTVAGGAQPITWSGTVPAGLNLNTQTGTLWGIPTGTGAQTINLTATDANGAAVNLSFSLNIAPASATLAVISNSIPRGQVGVPYSGSLFAAGGSAPYAWTLLTPAALPAGLSLDASTGTISGTPTLASSTATTFRVTDNLAATADSGTITLDIDGVLTITTSSLPLAGVSSGYGAGLSATGGVGTLTWSLVSGSLPAGLGLTPAGTIGGTCSATAVTSSFQVRVTDSLGRTANRSFTITVGPQIFPPSGGGGGGGGGCGGSIGLGSIPLGALASLAALLALAARRRK